MYRKWGAAAFGGPIEVLRVARPWSNGEDCRARKQDIDLHRLHVPMDVAMAGPEWQYPEEITNDSGIRTPHTKRRGDLTFGFAIGQYLGIVTRTLSRAKIGSSVK